MLLFYYKVYELRYTQVVCVPQMGVGQCSFVRPR